MPLLYIPSPAPEGNLENPMNRDSDNIPRWGYWGFDYSHSMDICRLVEIVFS